MNILTQTRCRVCGEVYRNKNKFDVETRETDKHKKKIWNNFMVAHRNKKKKQKTNNIKFKLN